jgi:hypothetical protein
MTNEEVTGAHFSPRRRTAVVLTGEGTSVGYLAGVVRALDAAGVRMDVVLGRGVGAIVAAFSAFHAEEKICAEGGLLDAMARERPFRIAPFPRFAAYCLAASFFFFVAPAFLGFVSIIMFPVQALVRELLPAGVEAAPSLLSLLVTTVSPYYLPAVALPVIVLFTGIAARKLASWRRQGRDSFLPEELSRPAIDLAPLARAIEGRLWQTVRGASSDEAPRDKKALGEAFTQLLTQGMGQQGFRELVFYALDTDSGTEVPFMLLKERYGKALAARSESARSEPIDLASEGSAILFDALLSAVSPPGLVPEVPLTLPRGHRFGCEVHRFASSLVSGRGALADAVACGAEQVIYVTASPRGERSGGSVWERLAATALKASLLDDLAWAASTSGVPVFVIRPEVERVAPFELSGRAQTAGDRLAPSVLVDQGARDAERLFIRPLLGDEADLLGPETTVPIDRTWQAGPKEL